MSQAPPGIGDQRKTSPAQKDKAGRFMLLMLAVFVLLLALVVWHIARAPAREAPGPVRVEGEFIHHATLVLPETSDAGQQYLDGAVFVGDSNTVRMYNYGLLAEGQVLAKENIGIEAVTELAFVEVEGAGAPCTIVEAIALCQPERVVITLGTNDIREMSPNAYVHAYREAIEAIQGVYTGPIIVNAIPPVRRNNSYENLTNEKVKTFNFMLRSTCAEMGLPFLDSTEVLANPGGWALPLYTVSDGVHFSTQGGQALLQYVRTHAYDHEIA